MNQALLISNLRELATTNPMSATQIYRRSLDNFLIPKNVLASKTWGVFRQEICVLELNVVDKFGWLRSEIIDQKVVVDVSYVLIADVEKELSTFYETKKSAVTEQNELQLRRVERGFDMLKDLPENTQTKYLVTSLMKDVKHNLNRISDIRM